MALQEERNKRLDALLAASKAWTDKRIKELEGRVTMTKRILKGRTGAERLANNANQVANEVVVKAIDDFLTGD